VYQAVVFVRTDMDLYCEVLHREETSNPIAFYRTIDEQYLNQIESQDPLVVVRDVRIYFPDSERWIVRSFWNLDYDTVERIKPDLLMLWSQRIGDYTREGALESALNPTEFQQMYEFYKDVQAASVRGYRTLHRDGEGVLLVSETLYDRFFR
jgi:hypothetical protein